MRTFFLVVLVILACADFNVYAQVDTSASNSVESVQVTKPPRKRKFIFSFDNRNSFINRDRARMFGIRMGIEVIGSHRWGIGIYGLSDQDSLHRDIIITYAIIIYTQPPSRRSQGFVHAENTGDDITGTPLV